MVLLETDPATARRNAREGLSRYLSLKTTSTTGAGSVSATPISPAAAPIASIDANVAWGDEDAIRAHIQKHWDAGADHVCIQAINTDSSRKLADEKIFDLLAPALS